MNWPSHVVRLVALTCTAIVALTAAVAPAARAQTDDRPSVVIVPLVNGTVSGWLVDFATERNYMVNTYLEQLDALDRDPEYSLTFVEVPTMIAMRELAPERFEQLRRHLASGRVDLGSALYHNPTVSLTGGEALMRLGIEGIRWQQAEFGRRPRVAWLVDTVGMHRQMPQIARQLGIDLLIYARGNPTGQHTHRWRSPDGSSVLAVGTGVYGGIPSFFTATDRLRREEVTEIARLIQRQRAGDAPGVPTLMLAAAGDYGKPPAYQRQAGRLLQLWAGQFPDTPLDFGTPSSYRDQLAAAAEGTALVELAGDSEYVLDAFWVNIPRVKQGVRRAEHQVMTAEALSTVASLAGDVAYPAAELADAWINLLLNMDRGVLWGLGTGEVFESPTVWDVRDRFEAIDALTGAAVERSLASLTGGPANVSAAGAGAGAVVFFNPLAWERREPVLLHGTGGRGLAGEPCERRDTDDDAVLCLVSLPSFGLRVVPLGEPAATMTPADPSRSIDAGDYSVRIDPHTGDLVSIVSGRTSRELLGGPANALVLERHGSGPETQDDLLPRAERVALGSTRDAPADVRVWRGPFSSVAEVAQQLPQGIAVRRTLRFHRFLSRIDVETTIENVPSGHLVSADFPLAGPIVGEDRGIPFGHAAPGAGDSIHPAIRWSAVETAAGGLAILDRGVPGREIAGSALILPLLNAHDAYRGKPNAWLSGQGEHRFEYSIVPLDQGWRSSAIPRQARERDAPPVVRVLADSTAMSQADRSWLRTSDNVIVESVRRVGRELEIRLTEWPGTGGSADVELGLPVGVVYLTDALGEGRQPLDASGPIRLDLRPQQIVTLRIEVPSTVEDAPPLSSYRRLVPLAKAPSLTLRHLLSGHPPE